MLSIYTYTEIGGDMKSVRKIVDELQTTTAHHFLSFCRFPWYNGRQLPYAGTLLHIMASSEEAAPSFVLKLCVSVTPYRENHTIQMVETPYRMARRLPRVHRGRFCYIKRGPVRLGKLHQ